MQKNEISWCWSRTVYTTFVVSYHLLLFVTDSSDDSNKWGVMMYHRRKPRSKCMIPSLFFIGRVGSCMRTPDRGMR